MNELIKQELDGLYGQSVNADMANIINLYNFYEGEGQKWATNDALDYIPTKIRTNITKKLINDQARFLFGRTPEFVIDADDGDQEKILQAFIDEVLKNNNISKKLLNAAKDAFIGKRVAIKLHADADTKELKIFFKPSLEFVYDTDIDDTDQLTKIIFFYQLNSETDKNKQRIWKQKYELVDNKCIVNEGIYNGYGKIQQIIKDNIDTGLDFIPAFVIVNGGLTGDLLGESDIAEDLQDNQHVYNHLKSDDIDALKFNMYPQKAAIDADEKSLESLVIAPGALIDLQSADSNKQAKYEVVESQFSYDQRFENAINRIKGDMYDSLSIPNISLEQLKGLMQSGKSMKALYWGLISRCEEKWTTWRPALEWLIKSIIKLAKEFNIVKLPDVDYIVEVVNLYPIIEDEEQERSLDMAEVAQQVRSRKNYIKKWGINTNIEDELKQIATEQSLLQDAFIQSIDSEI
jgi:thiol-disulfide isomerase/thioredoxin